ncbi:NinG protein [Vibrio phage 1.148.O._10N.286.54.A10]|nr:NinG protein [Vibrio phage 1.148.O._10N.286.54.A10]
MSTLKKRCPQCRKYFLTEEMMRFGAQHFCTFDHAVQYANKASTKAKGKAIKEKEQRKELRKRKEETRPKSWYTKEAQKWFNKYIRLRDNDEPCICCGRENTDDIQWHAGHFLTTGARPEHRFNEDNCHKQTSYCNNYLSGNVAEYRKRLIEKIGKVKVEVMERDHKQKNYTIDDLKEIISKYKLKCKDLE